MQYHEKICEFIKEKRVKSGLSLSEFAYKNFMEPATLSRYENNLRKISLQNLVKIANGFGQSPAEFLADFEGKYRI